MRVKLCFSLPSSVSYLTMLWMASSHSHPISLPVELLPPWISNTCQCIQQTFTWTSSQFTTDASFHTELHVMLHLLQVTECSVPGSISKPSPNPSLIASFLRNRHQLQYHKVGSPKADLKMEFGTQSIC